MVYRELGNLGITVSALGFGAMRLPVRTTSADIDEPLAISMMRYAFDHGVNYVDTGYNYHEGNSEKVVGKALWGGYRSKVLVATKMPVWLVESLADCDRILEEQLGRLETDRVDFYLLHNIQKRTWLKARSMGITDWCEKVMSDGRIGHLGFSFHDSLDVFQEILDDYDRWSFCQIQYNYVNEDVQAGTAGLELAAKRGLGVVVMEPLFGGSLATPPEGVREIFRAADGNRSPADWALHWLWNKPEVSVVLSGMSTMDQVMQNVASAAVSGVRSMLPEEEAVIKSVQERYQQFNPIPCTTCGYCLPCPNTVDIPRNFELFNNATVFGGNSASLSSSLYAQMSPERTAGNCRQCGECEARCPQSIEIRKWMPRVHARLATTRP